MEKVQQNFDKQKYINILKLKSQKNILEAIQQFEIYLKKYPNDVRGLICFSFLLMEFGYLKESSDIIHSIDIDEDAFSIDAQNLLLAKLKLYGAQGDYEKCFELFYNNISYLRANMDDYRVVEAFLLKKMGLFVKGDFLYSYAVRQVIRYDEELAIEHIVKNHSYSNSRVKSEFSPAFDIRKCYFKIREMLPIDGYPRLITGVFRNMYVLKCMGCGMIFGSEEKLDYIKVVVLNDSNDIITMYPSNNEENYPCIDITSKLNNDKVLSKRLSQIDKFNKRYGL